jgi:hypothetical protein
MATAVCVSVGTVGWSVYFTGDERQRPKEMYCSVAIQLELARLFHAKPYISRQGKGPRQKRWCTAQSGPSGQRISWFKCPPNAPDLDVPRHHSI